MLKKDDIEKLKKEEIKILNYFVKICDENNLKYYLSYGTLLGAVRHKGFIPWDDDIDVSMPPLDYQKFINLFTNSKEYFLQTIDSEKYYHTVFAKIRKNNTCMVEKEWQYIKIHKGINIDIFPLLPYPNNLKERKKFDLKLKIASLLVSKNNKTYSIKNKLVFEILKLCPRKITNKIASKLMNDLLNYQGEYSNYKVELNEGIFNTKWFDKSIKIRFENKTYNVPKEYDEILKVMYGDYMTLPPKNERIGHGDIILSFDKDYDDLNRE